MSDFFTQVNRQPASQSATFCELKRGVPDALNLPLEALLPGVELDDLDVVEDLVHRLDQTSFF